MRCNVSFFSRSSRTKVSWEEPFEVVKADGHLGTSSPWSGHLDHLLYDDVRDRYSGLVHTSAAGIVAVHFAFAQEDFVVVSVSADPRVEWLEAYRAAHEVAESFRRRPPKIDTCSLSSTSPSGRATPGC